MAIKIKLTEVDEPEELARFLLATSGGQIDSITKAVARNQRHGTVFVARRRAEIVATLCLTKRKPWAIDPKYFTQVKAPLYLLAMAVAPKHQRQGIGRACLEDAYNIAESWQAEAIRLDAYNNPTGAGGFYERCGYREVGRVVYRNTPLIYFERLVGSETKV